MRLMQYLKVWTPFNKTIKDAIPLVFISVLLLIVLTCKRTYAQDITYFDIPKQSANKALIEYAKQSKLNILFSFEVTAKYQSNSIKGYYPKQFALERILRDSGLLAKIDQNQQIAIIESETQQNIAAANISDKKQTLVSQVGEQTQSDAKALEKIAIIGSRGGYRNIETLPVAIDVLNTIALENTGEIALGNVLQNLAPSFNHANSSISDGTDVLHPVTLRGLGPDQTLILVNGKRRHQASLVHINSSVGRGTAGSDINTIPVSAIKRIEILRDGAAAQYGSDAIAGVINIVLKDASDADNINANYGKFSQGDGESWSTSINKSFNINNKGYIATSFNFIERAKTNRSGLHGSCLYDGCQLLDNGHYLIGDARELTANRKTFEIGQPAYLQSNFAVNINYPITHGELYGFVTYSNRENDSAAFFRQGNNHKANPLIDQENSFHPQGYLPYIHSDIRDISYNFGINHSFSNSTFADISYTYGKNTIDYFTKNSLNASYVNWLRYQQNYSAQQITDNTPSHAFAYGLALSLETLNIDIRHDFSDVSLALGAEFRTDKYQIIAGEKYAYTDYDGKQNQPNFPANAFGGIQGFPGIAPTSAVDEVRDVVSLYLELETELFDQININGALRYDDYEGLPDTSNSKLAANWQITPNIFIRGSVSTGFRAPSMQQLYFSNTSTQFVVNDLGHLNGEQVSTIRNDGILAKSLGIPQLKEEQSTNYSIGSVFKYQAFKLAVDFYHIDIEDRIVISHQLGKGLSPALDQALANNEIDKIQLFLNGIDTETKGIDILASYQQQFNNASINYSLAANYTSTDVTNFYTPERSPLESLPVDSVFSQHDISIIETWQPKNRLAIAVNYQTNNWQMDMSINRYGQYTIVDGNSQTYGAEWVTNIKLKQQLTKEISWYVGANNLFNTTPDKNNIGNSHSGTLVTSNGDVVVSSPGVFTYSRRSAPFGFNGAYWYAGLSYKF